MGKNSAIEWTDHTFNPWWGCVKISPGCKNCYADTLASRYGHDVWGVDKPRRFFGDKHWQEPYTWNRHAAMEGRRYKVFCGSMCDVFEVHPDLDEQRRRLWKLIEDTEHLDWLLLTKRPCEVPSMVPIYWWDDYWPPNAWVGTSVENQDQADKRIPNLLRIPAPVRFLSCEPLLAPVSLWPWLSNPTLAAREFDREPPLIDWVIVGGESGPGARPMNPLWAKAIRDQCYDAGTPFFMKQMGGHPNKRGHLEDMPEGLRYREFPDVHGG